MKCKNCGAEFNEGVFCPECGTKVEIELDKEESKRQEQNQIAREKVVRTTENKGKAMSIISLVCGIASWIGLLTVIIPLVCGIIAIICGIKALKNRTKHKGYAIIGIILAVLVYVFIIWAILQPSSNSTSSSTNTPSTETTAMLTTELVESEEEKIISDKDVTKWEDESIEQTVQEKVSEESNQGEEQGSEEEFSYDKNDLNIMAESNSNLTSDVDFRSLSSEEKLEWISIWMKTIDEFDYHFESDAKKLMPIYKEASEADESEFIFVKPEEKGIINPTTYYVQSLSGYSYYYYGNVKDGKPDGKGVIFYDSGAYTSYITIANFKDGFIDGYAIECNGVIIESEGFYDKGVLDGEYVSYRQGNTSAYKDLYKNEEFATDWYEYSKINANGDVQTIILDMPLSGEYVYYQGKYKDGEKTGIWKNYFDDMPGIYLHSEIKYKKDKAIEGTIFYSNGNVKYKGDLSGEGVYDGKGILYNEDGTVQYKGKFEDGDIAK